ncbi:MAG: alpha/beta fold hydrolase [Pseudomonadota bacterium]
MWHSTSATQHVLCASVIAATLALAGCTGLVADRIVEAPNQRGAYVDGATATLIRQTLNGRREVLRTPVADMVLLHVPRHPFEITLTTRQLEVATPEGIREADIYWSYEPVASETSQAESQGTVVVLHGYAMGKEVMGSFAALLADAGFDVVLVDLPGHGESSGELMTWGIREAEAITALREALEARSAPRPLIGFGVSLGGSVALRAAATEPGWDAVVALQPFEDPAAVIPNFRAMAPTWLRFLVSGRRLEKAVAVAGQRAGFDFEDAQLAPLLGDYTVPTLIEHGRMDSLVPVSESEKIAAAAPGIIDLIIDEDADHFLLPLMLWRRCPNVMAWLGQQFDLPRPEAACERIIYNDPDGLWDAYRERRGEASNDD